MFNFVNNGDGIDLVLNPTILKFIMKMIGTKVFRNPKNRYHDST
jgi:hypothetical protein